MKMVNTRKYRDRVCYSFNTDRDLINQAQQHAKKNGYTTSEYLNNLVREDLQKNAIRAANPTNIHYITNIIASKSLGITIPLDDFIKVDHAKAIINNIVTGNHNLAFHNTRKVYQQLQQITEGKITV